MRKILSCLALLNCLSCQPQPASNLAAKAEVSSGLPTREELLQQFRNERRLLIVYGDGLESVAQQVKQRHRRTECTLIPEGEVSRGQLKTSALLLIGANWANPVARELVSQLPFDMEEGILQFGSHHIGGANTVFCLSFYPNPLARALPIGLITAFDPGDILRFYQQRKAEGFSVYNWASMGYEVYQNGQRLLMGAFDEKKWEPDSSTEFDFTNARDTAMAGRYFNFFLHQVPPTSDQTRELINNCEAHAEKILAFCQAAPLSHPIPCHLYPSLEQKGLRLDNTQPAQADFSRGEVHLVANEIFRGRQAGPENALLLRQMLGRPKLEAMERGLALYFTDNWQEKGYAYWAARLYQSGNIAPLAEILDNEQFNNGSPLVMGCLSASFVDFLIGHWGRRLFLERYASWRPSPEELPRLEASWHENLSKPQPQPLSPSPHHPASSAPPLPYLKGFNFAHEGYAIYNGYGSGLASESLRELHSLGANAVAIVPYSYMRNAQAPSTLPFMTHAGSETDEGVIHDAFVARQLGMKTVLKPQIWLGGGSWPGDVEMQSEADWNAFFNHYYRWMRHYALLAEMNGMDMLCIGVEFAKATLEREQDWRELIGKLRGLYSGPMTYSANWGKEFENLQFWDALDYIGLNGYYPLSQSESPSDEELSAAFQRVLHLAGQVSRQYGKPLLFTEIGFTSTPEPWAAPHKDRDGSPYNGQAQERCYRIVMANLQAETDWCKGILWWKFPTYLSRGGPGHTGFTPNGKPAEKAVKEGFGRLP
ncbi:MAG: hypothetical protein H6560_21890 [Lewinellaceae bacterium]|nr:hypothetical protein [Lewinellaceae bacterium]